MTSKRWLPSPGTLLGTAALIVALSGVAIALPGKNTVNSGDIRNNQVKEKDVADVKFKPLTLLNGWTPYGGVYESPGVAKDGFGFVHLQGAIGGGDSITEATAFRLAPRYRPRRQLFHPVDTSGAVYGRVQVTAEGFVTLSGTDAAFTDFTELDGVTFKAR